MTLFVLDASAVPALLLGGSGADEVKSGPKPPIAVPTCVRWGDRDPILRSAWGDTLGDTPGDTFTDLDVQPFAGLGHVRHREDPDRAADEIDRFYRAHRPG